MRVLVTGINGFTGLYLKEELIRNGYKVVGLKSDISHVESLNAEIKRIQPEYVVHLAGVSFVNHKKQRELYEINLIGTFNLLVALSKAKSNLRSILLVSSASIYGERHEYAINEDALPNPSNDYAVSKLSMENMAKLWTDKLPISIARPFNYTGVGQNEIFLIPKIVSHFRKDSPVIELGNIDISREFGDVRDVVDIYRKLLELNGKGGVFNICTGKCYSIREVIRICENITGKKITVKVNSDFIRANDARRLLGDNNHLKGTIQKKHWHNLDETLRWMLF